MKRYIITSPTYTGEINVLYGLDEKLLYIDLMKAELNEEQITWFKSRVPAVHADDFKDAFVPARLNITEEGYRVTFDQFWERYNLKRNRARCEKIWNRLSEADQVAAFFKYKMYERHLQLNQWKTKADPDTYLRNRYWDDDWTK